MLKNLKWKQITLNEINGLKSGWPNLLQIRSEL